MKKNFKCKDMSEKYELSRLNIALLDSDYYFICNVDMAHIVRKWNFVFKLIAL